MPSVAILSTGYEVLRGFTANTNATWLAARATDLGAHVVAARTVGDALDDVVDGLRDALARATTVLVTGGLGPTEDDRTREALALVAGVPLVPDPRARALLAARLARSNRALTPAQERQALVPRGFEPLPNSQGTAPGVCGALDGRRVFLLPGPPREMRAVFDEEVVPRWRTDAGFAESAARVVWTAGCPEPDVGAALLDLMRADEPTVGTHPDDGEVAVRLLASGPDAAARADALREEIVRRLGAHVVSTAEDVRVAAAVVGRVRARGLVLTTAESVTGGLVARMLVAVPGASDVFRGGIVAYSDAWKAERLGVPAEFLASEGAVSEAVARAMAEGARARSGADLAVSTTGVAGPGPDARGTPEGTVFVGISSSFAPTSVASTVTPASREAIQRRAAVLALDRLRRLLAP